MGDGDLGNDFADKFDRASAGKESLRVKALRNMARSGSGKLLTPVACRQAT